MEQQRRNRPRPFQAVPYRAFYPEESSMNKRLRRHSQPRMRPTLQIAASATRRRCKKKRRQHRGRKVQSRSLEMQSGSNRRLRRLWSTPVPREACPATSPLRQSRFAASAYAAMVLVTLLEKGAEMPTSYGKCSIGLRCPSSIRDIVVQELNNAPCDPLTRFSVPVRIMQSRHPCILVLVIE